MATINYTKRLENLRARRFDQDLNESILSKSFSDRGIAEDIKYLLESMQPLAKQYNEKTLTAANNVQKHLERELNLHFARAYRTQGSVTTSTNIKVHSDFDLLTIIDKYHYPESTPAELYTQSNPDEDILDLRRQATKIMKKQYDIVDETGDKCISITNQNLNRKVDIVFGYWYLSDKYNETKDEYYRGIYLYNFPKKEKQKDFPFATIHNVNVKGNATNDGFRRAVRLLKTLKADCDTEIKILKSFQLTSLAYAIDNSKLHYSIGKDLNIAQAVSDEMRSLIDNSTYRKSIKSPNGIEQPLSDDKVVEELKLLKTDLDVVIQDAAKDIRESSYMQKSILTYNTW